MNILEGFCIKHRKVFYYVTGMPCWCPRCYEEYRDRKDREDVCKREENRLNLERSSAQ